MQTQTTGEITTGIRTSKETKNIAAVMSDVQKEINPIKKEGRNTAQNYSYAKFEDYVEEIKTTLAKHDLFIITSQNPPVRLESTTTKTGSVQHRIEVSLVVRIVHNSGEWIEIDGYGEGADFGDKAVYKAITGARKYALACLLGLATKDDPENDEDNKKPQDSQPYKSNGAGFNKNKNPLNNNHKNSNTHSVGSILTNAINGINAAKNTAELNILFSNAKKQLIALKAQQGAIDTLKNAYTKRINKIVVPLTDSAQQTE